MTEPLIISESNNFYWCESLRNQPIGGFFERIGFTAIYGIRVHRQLDFGAFDEFPFGEGIAAELVGFVFDGTNEGTYL
jgi:hypothetical protein